MTGPTEVSAREAEVLTALADGRSNAQIARKLHISERTVESHVSSLLRKVRRCGPSRTGWPERDRAPRLSHR